MEQTRKAFVVLAAAISAGNLPACLSSDKDQSPGDKSDAAQVVAKDAAAGSDNDAAPDQRGAPDSGQDRVALAEDAAAAADLEPASDSSQAKEDVVAAADLEPAYDSGQERVVLREDASRPATPDGSLAMPAGTIYDVLTRADLA